jgi:glycyl-tRNA synthetase beta chain
MDTLLIEIGAEEIPAGYIEPALQAFSSLMTKQLTHARIKHGAARVYGTPRRLTVEIADVAEAQTPVTTEMTGPPKSVGFDDAGKPTMAAMKFAEKAGVSIDNIYIKETKKGSYLCADKVESTLPTREILPGVLPDVIAAIPFPKSMKWGELNVTFARPVRWILALLGNDVVPFAYGDVESENHSYGHRFMHPESIRINHPGEYINALKRADVLVDLDQRRDIIEKEISRTAEGLGGRIIPDEELIDTVKNLVEFPAVAAGKFDDIFLEVPDEVLITAMREHQKYFAVVDANQKLLPCFIVVNNTVARDMRLVATGHERVIRARLSDARFFFTGDAATPMETWVEKLKKVLFQAQLGSVHDKILRVQKIAEFIAGAVDGEGDLKANVSRAARFCKADLVSQVVVEFPKLQGVMGRIYATLAGEPDAVATAIEEHYQPTYSGGPLPASVSGAILAVADKIDSICGCFSIGLAPTGASDPYALRRQGIGILQIMNAYGFSFSLREMIERSVAALADVSTQPAEETCNTVYGFLKGRMAHILEEDGYAKDVIASVTDISIDHIPHVWKRVAALEKLKAEPDFEPLAVAFKRVVNIIKKSEDARQGIHAVNESLFEHPSESDLFSAFQNVNERVRDQLASGQFDQALLDIASLKDRVDAFFDGVMVMAENIECRNNRLALLKQIAEMFGRFADFSKIST